MLYCELKKRLPGSTPHTVGICLIFSIFHCNEFGLVRVSDGMNSAFCCWVNICSECACILCNRPRATHVSVRMYIYTQILHACRNSARLSSLHRFNALSANSVPFSCLFPSSIALYNNQRQRVISCIPVAYHIWGPFFASTESGKHDMLGWDWREWTILSYTELTLLASPLSSRVRSNWRAQPRRTPLHRVCPPQVGWAGQVLVHR